MKKDEYKLTDLISILLMHFALLKRNWLYIVGTCVVFSVLGIVLRPDKEYQAEAVIMLNESDGGGLLSVASEFGLGSSQTVTFEKFVGVAKSFTAFKTVLLKEVEVKGDSRLFIDYVIESKGIRKENKWALDSMLTKISFKNAGYKQDSVLKDLYNTLKESIDVTENREKMIVLTTSDVDPVVSLLMNQLLVDYIGNFFESLETQSDLNTQSALQTKLDSVVEELRFFEKTLAQRADNSFMVVKREGLIDRARAERQVRVLNEIYVELVKQLEIINFRVMEKKPALEVIDPAGYPLIENGRGLGKILFIACFAGAVLCSFFIILIYWGKKLIKMADPESIQL